MPSQPSLQGIRENAVYALVGASYLWPWNCVLSVIPLVARKLEGQKDLQNALSSSLMTCSTISGLLVCLYTALKARNFGSRVRNGELLIAMVFVVFATLLITNLKGWQFFIPIVMLFCLSSAGCALVQNGSFSIAQHVPGGQQIRAILIGQAIAGVVPSLMVLLTADSKLGTSKATKSMAEYALPGYMLLSCSALAILAFTLFRGHSIQTHVEKAESQQSSPPKLSVLFGITRDLATPIQIIILIYGVSLSYPVFANTVLSSQKSQASFAALTHFRWNLMDLIGRLICEFESLRLSNVKVIFSLAVLRIAIIPVLLHLVHQQTISELKYGLLMEVFGLSNGYLLASVLSVAPSFTSESLQAAAGGVVSFAISAALTVGALVSFVVSIFI